MRMTRVDIHHWETSDEFLAHIFYGGEFQKETPRYSNLEELLNVIKKECYGLYSNPPFYK